MSYRFVIVEHEKPVSVITLNRPEKRNALSIALQKELVDCLRFLEDDPMVRVVLITGSGPAFCAGFDLAEVVNRDPEHVRLLATTSERYHDVLMNLTKPLVAAVNGPALAGGFDLALLCDVRIASEAASFGHPEIRFGSPTLYSVLKEVVGGGIARDLCLSGRIIDAAEALRIGLVSKVVPTKYLGEEAMAFAQIMAKNPLTALTRTKRRIIALSEARHLSILEGGEDSFAGIELDKMRPRE